jgi:hypothetical protein
MIPTFKELTKWHVPNIRKNKIKHFSTDGMLVLLKQRSGSSSNIFCAENISQKPQTK